MRNSKGVIIPVVLVFQCLFAAVAVVAIAHIPARQALKTKLTDKCVADTGKAREVCKHEIDGMTQKERVALDKK